MTFSAAAHGWPPFPFLEADMAKEESFAVVRRHIGDRPYEVGETRVGSMADLGHLVPRVLQPLAGKADAAPENKAMGAAPANKAKIKAEKPAKGQAAATTADAPATADAVAPQAEEAPQADTAATEADQAEQGE
jgi:hypothetical protein